jgi:hypothetical protein
VNKNEVETDQIGASPYTNITVGRIQTGQIISPTPISSRHSLLAHQRPKQKVRKPSKEFLNNKSGLLLHQIFSIKKQTNLSHIEESELSTDDIFWSKHLDDLPPKPSSPVIYPILPKLTSPPSEQKTLTPSTPTANILANTSPSNIGTLRAKAHNFISRNILIPETCCVVC